MMALDYNFYSLNTHGLADDAKRRSLFHHLNTQYKKGVFFLQETHSSSDTIDQWQNEFGGRIYSAHGAPNSCGVAILVPAGISLSVENVYEDKEGRFVILETLADGQCTLLVNVYAPTRNHVNDQCQFLRTLEDKILNFDYVNLIMGGDWNTIFSPKLDKKGGSEQDPCNRYTKKLMSFMETHELVDAIRIMHPKEHIFTRFQRNPTVLSRIDHWLVSDHLMIHAKETNVFPGFRSDHSIIHLNICEMKEPRGPGTWKFSSALLSDREYVANTNTLINSLIEEHGEMVDKGLQWDLIKCKIRGATITHSKRIAAKKRKEMKALNDQ